MELARKPAPLLFVFAVTLAVSGTLLWTQAFGTLGSKALDDLGQVAGDLFAAGAALAAARRTADRPKKGWTLIAAGATFLALGQLGGAGADFGLGPTDVLTYGSILFYVLTIPLGFVGVAFILFPAHRPAALLRIVLDSLLITLSLLFISVALVLDKLFVTTSLTGLDFAVFVVYSAGDVAVCSIALLGLSRAPAWLRPTALTLLAGFVSLAAGDGIQAGGNLYATGSPIDTLYLAGALLIGLAALRAPARSVGRPVSDEEFGLGLAIPYVPPLLALVVAAVIFIERLPYPLFLHVVGLSVVLVAMVGLAIHRIDLVRLLKRSEAAEAWVAASRLMLERVLASAPAALLSFDGAGKISLVRGHPVGFTRRGAALEGQQVQELVAGYPSARSMIEEALRGKPAMASFELDGGELDMICTPILGPDGCVQSVTSIVLDVTSQRRLQREIADNEAKSQLLATVSHELRTPLHSILGFAHLIAAGKAGPLTDKQRRYIGHVQSSGRHLLRLINGILDFSKLDAGGELDVEVAAVDAKDLIAAAVEEMRPLAGDRSIEAGGLEPTRVMADPVRLEQILLNLLANAVQATDATGRISVSSRPAQQRVEIAISDDGVGIAEDDLERVFSRYHQVFGNGRKKGGTGLGLPISRHLAEKMHGTLTVESAPGRGSTFRLCLPLA